jgi:hypothetical protein
MLDSLMTDTAEKQALYGVSGRVSINQFVTRLLLSAAKPHVRGKFNTKVGDDAFFHFAFFFRKEEPAKIKVKLQSDKWALEWLEETMVACSRPERPCVSLSAALAVQVTRVSMP